MSDTHIPAQLAALPPALLDRLHDVDLILHAGDIATLSVLDVLGELCEVAAVYGNGDGPLVKAHLPSRRLLSCKGRRIGLIHGDRPRAIEASYTGPLDNYESPVMAKYYDYLTKVLPTAEVIVFGHFHVPLIKTWNGRMLLNPGAVAHKTQSSFAILSVSPDDISAEIVELPPCDG